MSLPKVCIYCGGIVTKVRKGEHVIPKGLGGTVGLSSVCTTCNNGTLSILDKELVSRSPLAYLAWEELPRVAPDCWDYEPTLKLALEARVLPGYLSPCLWPQVILEKDSSSFHADWSELQKFGWENYVRRFKYCSTLARRSFGKDKPRGLWIWDKVKDAPSPGRFPPRVFTKHTFGEIDEGSHFICRYLGGIDQDEILWRFDRWRPLKGNWKVGAYLGVINPEGHQNLRPRLVVRSLVKIGINLLAHVCKKTHVDREHFADAVRFVLEDAPVGITEGGGGFVWNEDIARLECPIGAHKFRLTHFSPNWTLQCSFFGGRAGAVVTFPGPNFDNCVRWDITAPLQSREWVVKTSPIVLPIPCHIEWTDVNRIMPSVRITNVSARPYIERKRRPSSN